MVINDKEKNEICESCADHVCNEDCGCQLSEEAIQSIKKYKEKQANKK